MAGKPSMTPVRPRDEAAHDVEGEVEGEGVGVGGVGTGERNRG